MTATWRILEGDCRTMLRTMPERSVQTCVTSPPYFGLRDYGTGEWEGGDVACDHVVQAPPVALDDPGIRRSTLDGGKKITTAQAEARQFRETCPRCGARRVDRQIGLEPTPDEFVQALVGVFREVRRVLRDDGTVWVNLGDSYGPEKQLQGIPWRFAFAMQADGWVLRSDVVWAKPNPMPESVTDRPTKSHEFIFMFAKGRERAGRFVHISDEDARWLALFVDTEGCITVKRTREVCGAQVSVAGTCRALLERAQAIVGAGNILEREGQNAPMFYWQVSNKAARDLLLRLYPHLIVKQRQARICLHIESMTGRSGEAPSDRRAAVLDRLWEANKSCNSFGDPDISWVPEPNVFLLSKGPRYFYDADSIREAHLTADDGRNREDYEPKRMQPVPMPDADHQRIRTSGASTWPEGGRNKRSVWTVATQPYSGAHFATFPAKLIEPCILAGCPEGGTVLDPFAGAGTTGVVALRHNRSFVGIELNPEYVELARDRIIGDAPLLNSVAEAA